MEYLIEYFLFTLKFSTIALISVMAVAILLTQLMQFKMKNSETVLKISSVNNVLEEHIKEVKKIVLNKDDYKAYNKQEKKKQKAAKDKSLPKLYVLDFVGDINAKNANKLADSIDIILQTIDQEDQILVKIESGGGTVHNYGYASSQLQRLRDRNIPLTISIDKVAASGGYLMACTADQIIAAPFAIVGSIGVIAQIPNFNKALKKYDIDLEQHQAGSHKRTITMFGENTEVDRARFKEDLEQTHKLFKNYITNFRKELDIEKVSNGKYWYGTDALELKLVDQIKTSEDFIMDKINSHKIVKIEFKTPSNLSKKFSLLANRMLDLISLKTNVI